MGRSISSCFNLHFPDVYHSQCSKQKAEPLSVLYTGIALAILIILIIVRGTEQIPLFVKRTIPVYPYIFGGTNDLFVLHPFSA